VLSEAALLEAIYAAPERDEPRLVYADWLLEQHDLRGELIQLQVTQARLRRRSAAHTRLQRRVDALLAAGWAAWSPKVKPRDPSHFCEWAFTRGFATHVHTVAPAFIAQIDEFFEAAPLLEDVALDCGRLGPLALAPVGWLEQMFAAPAFQKVKTLRLQSINDTGAVALSGLAEVGRLNGLELARSNLAGASFELLGDARSPLHRLQSLELMMANAREVALEHLLEHRWPRLRTLMIGNESIGERGLKAIAKPGKLPALKRLDLSWSLLGGERSIQALGEALPSLEELELSHCAVTDAMCDALAGATGFQLRFLGLAHSEITAVGVRALLGTRVLEQLELLDLTGCRLDEQARSLLVELGQRVVVSA
jgi:uncharacterized protein (TIGR02996 family)